LHAQSAERLSSKREEEKGNGKESEKNRKEDPEENDGKVVGSTRILKIQALRQCRGAFFLVSKPLIALLAKRNLSRVDREERFLTPQTPFGMTNFRVPEVVKQEKILPAKMPVLQGICRPRGGLVVNAG
jgi:hypothetical protein